MKIKLMRIGLILIFITGLGILLYPTISNLLMNIFQTTAIQQYNYTVEQMEQDKIEEILSEARVYNEQFKNTIVVDPFSQEAESSVNSEYNEILNIDGTMGYIEIPKIDVNLPIFHGTSEEVLKRGVGHIETTPLPIGGEGNHSVLSAHRGLPSAKLFTDLDKLEIDDVFMIKMLTETLVYRIDQIKVVEPTDTQYLQAEEGEDYITLITCTPYAINTHRMLVRGTRMDTDEYLATINNGNLDNEKDTINYLFIFIIVVFIVLIVIFIFTKAIRRRKNEK
ncbi:class C sortase [Paraclostridium bifermentans]|uniref:class C sortase n=1 Tax=Paraclostridium bifermentans TaxID=1490 RepID=UPI00189CC61C|nr:class C sortase [Paraclostridium bifermentans]